jgi:hypothetical protein
MTSPDGITWTSRSSAGDKSWVTVVYGNGLFLAVASTQGYTMTSPDGITWTLHSGHFISFYDVAFGDGLFLAVGDNSGSPHGVGAFWSTDGITWDNAVGEDLEKMQWRTIAFGSGGFVGGGYSPVTPYTGAYSLMRVPTVGSYRLEKLCDADPQNVLVDDVSLDAAKTYDGVPATVITGLGHLEGFSVRALADGVVVDFDDVVTGEQVTLDTAASVVHIGLPFNSDLETLALDNGGGLIGRKVKVANVTVRFLRSREVWVGPDYAGRALMEWVTDVDYPTNEYDRDNPTDTYVISKDPVLTTWAIDLYTGDKTFEPSQQWGNQGRGFIRAESPGRVEILSIVPSLVIGET